MKNKKLMKRIETFEPWCFIFFGIFHMHRIWGIFDREAYTNFWMGLMVSKGLFYYLLMSVLAIFCILGIIVFFKNLHHNFWWRWIYLFGGSYILFDLFAIIVNLGFWNELIRKMYDINAPYWNLLWGMFILMGGVVFILGIYLLVKQHSSFYRAAGTYKVLWSVEKMNDAFWNSLEELVKSSEIVIDRPKGTAHPKYPDFIYQVDYGYLKSTTSMDGGGIDVWVGTGEKKIDAIMCIVDLMKRDSEIKILLGCTEEEKEIIYRVHNETQYMKGIMIRRDPFVVT